MGNGISTEPWALAQLGIEVVALEPSPVASQYAVEHPATAEEIASWFVGTETQADSRYREVGTVVLANADFQSYAYPSDGFDLAYVPWVWQGLGPQEQLELLQVASRIVRPGGCLLAGVQNMSEDDVSSLADLAAGAGFFRWDEASLLVGDPQAYSRAVEQDRSRAIARLRAGDRLLDVFTASG